MIEKNKVDRNKNNSIAWKMWIGKKKEQWSKKMIEKM